MSTTTIESQKTGEAKMKDLGFSEEQMKQWMQMASPGAAHAVFKKIEGTFHADVTSTAPNGAGEFKSTGTMVNTLILGGRYLENRYTGDCGQMAGVGFCGYDNAKQKYSGVWMDTMSTTVMVSEGSADASGNVITQHVISAMPCTPGAKARNVMSIFDENRHNYDMYMTGPDGREMRCLHIEYTRK